MTLLTAILVAVAVALWLPRGRSDRLPAATTATAPESADATRGSTWWISAAVGAAVAFAVSGLVGIGVGLGALLGCQWLLTRPAWFGVRSNGDLLALQAPEVADLLAACVAAGAGLEASGVAVAKAVDEPAAALFAAAVAHLRLGASPTAAFAEISAVAELAPIAAAITRSMDSGTRMADALHQCAEELRGVRRASLEAMARRVAVATVGPLGLCFLPAFLLLGVVPLVADLVQRSVTGL